MAIANLSETIYSHVMRKAELENQITTYQSQKSLAAYSQGDLQSLLNTEKSSIRAYFKDLYENDPELQEKYVDYTEIPDFEDEINKITAKLQAEIEELANWETALDAQITTCDTELQEIKVFLDSYKTMLSSNITDDFEFSLK